MLFWCFVIGLVLFAELCFVALDYCMDFLGQLSVAAAAVCGFAIFISLIIIVPSYLGVDGYIAESNTRYEMLVYQYKNDFYDNDNDLGKWELIEKIQDWNEDLAYNKKVQRDFWIGIYYPNIYDQFEFISLEE